MIISILVYINNNVRFLISEFKKKFLNDFNDKKKILMYKKVFNIIAVSNSKQVIFYST